MSIQFNEWMNQSIMEWTFEWTNEWISVRMYAMMIGRVNLSTNIDSVILHETIHSELFQDHQESRGRSPSFCREVDFTTFLPHIFLTDRIFSLPTHWNAQMSPFVITGGRGIFYWATWIDILHEGDQLLSCPEKTVDGGCPSRDMFRHDFHPVMSARGFLLNWHCFVRLHLT